MEDRILETHVIKWMKSVGVIDDNQDRFEEQELHAYTIIRNIFGKNRPNFELLNNSCEELKKYLDGGVKDEVFTAVRDFLKTTDIAKDNFTAFKELLEDRGFFTSSNEQPAETGNFEGVSMGTATYRRVEVGGDIYEGMFLGNERVWKGKISYANGSFYEGEWGNEGPHGTGVLKWKNGTTLTGSFKGLSGEGTINYQDGSTYQGPWNEEGPHGFGTWKIGNRIDKGQYANGYRVGSGRMDWEDGDWYEGEWNEKGPHGFGIWKIGNRIDKGQYKDGVRVGSGRMDWEDGDWYEGGWNEKGANGHGTYFYAAPKRTATGTWKDHSPIGDFKVKWACGDTYEGTYFFNANSKLVGEGVLYRSSTGKTRKGSWEDGEWHSDWATPRNIIGSVLICFAAIAIILMGKWLLGIGLGIVGKAIYEGS